MAQINHACKDCGAAEAEYSNYFNCSLCIDCYNERSEADEEMQMTLDDFDLEDI